MITVAELIQLLQEQPGDLPVCIATPDGEIFSAHGGVGKVNISAIIPPVAGKPLPPIAIAIIGKQID
jgi:hypothetical protein